MKTDDDLDRLHTLITRRAFEIFFRPDAHTGTALENWLRAKYEVETAPAAEVRKPRGIDAGPTDTPGEES
jgi:hypothetical protein